MSKVVAAGHLDAFILSCRQLRGLQEVRMVRRLRSGVANAVSRIIGFVSFVAEFDEGHLIDSSPFAPTEIRPTSWAIPLLRHEVVPVSAGEELALDLRAADLAVPSTWRWHTNE